MTIRSSATRATGQHILCRTHLLLALRFSDVLESNPFLPYKQAGALSFELRLPLNIHYLFVFKFNRKNYGPKGYGYGVGSGTLSMDDGQGYKTNPNLVDHRAQAALWNRNRRNHNFLTSGTGTGTGTVTC
jgi:hypothetical protein